MKVKARWETKDYRRAAESGETLFAGAGGGGFWRLRRYWNHGEKYIRDGIRNGGLGAINAKSEQMRGHPRGFHSPQHFHIVIDCRCEGSVSMGPVRRSAREIAQTILRRVIF